MLRNGGAIRRYTQQSKVSKENGLVCVATNQPAFSGS